MSKFLCTERPPQGVKPSYLWKEDRIEDLRAAINRYLDASRWPRVEWIREMADLIEERLSSPSPAERSQTVEIFAVSDADLDSDVNGLPSVATHRPDGPRGSDITSPPSGLVPPTQPSSPADDGWDDWADLVMRVNDSGHWPWTDENGCWWAKSPGTGHIQMFGRSDTDRREAYRWIDGILQSKVARRHLAAQETPHG